MDDERRRVYRLFGLVFLSIGAIFTLLALLDTVFAWSVFNGSPLRVALFVSAIGVLLLWTVRSRD